MKSNSDDSWVLDMNRNPYDIAEMLRIHVEKAREMLCDPKLEPLEGWGPVRLQKYILSRKKRFGAWPNEHYYHINQCRHLFDKGLVSMCQKSLEKYVILYAIPHAEKMDREPYFFVETNY